LLADGSEVVSLMHHLSQVQDHIAAGRIRQIEEENLMASSGIDPATF
jgi:hypothetical protein